MNSFAANPLTIKIIPPADASQADSPEPVATTQLLLTQGCSVFVGNPSRPDQPPISVVISVLEACVTIELADDALDNLQVEIDWSQELARWQVENISECGGTFVGGQEISAAPVWLTPGDHVIQVGRHRLLLTVHRPDPGPPSMPPGLPPLPYGQSTPSKLLGVWLFAGSSGN